MFKIYDKQLKCDKDMEFDTENEAYEFYGECLRDQYRDGNGGFDEDDYDSEEEAMLALEKELSTMTNKDLFDLFDYEVYKGDE